MAPIGHIVTVVGATQTPINITGTITVDSGYTLDGLMTSIKEKINEYLLEKRIEWGAQTDKQYITVRSAFILAKILEVKGVKDVDITFTGGTTKIDLEADAIPVLGDITLTQEV